MITLYSLFPDLKNISGIKWHPNNWSCVKAIAGKDWLQIEYNWDSGCCGIGYALTISFYMYICMYMYIVAPPLAVTCRVQWFKHNTICFLHVTLLGLCTQRNSMMCAFYKCLWFTVMNIGYMYLCLPFMKCSGSANYINVHVMYIHVLFMISKPDWMVDLRSAF